MVTVQLSRTFVTGDEDRERTETDFAEAPVITVPGPVIQKELVDTDVTDSANGLNEATIGEILTYEITVTLPEGMVDNVVIVDTLSAGLDFQDLSGTTVTAALRSASGSSVIFDPALGGTITGTASTIGSLRQVEFDLGDLTVAGDNTGNFDAPVLDTLQGDDQFIIEYRAVVLDIPANDSINSAAETFENTAVLNYTNRTADIETGPVSGDEVTLVEPDVLVTKTVNGLFDGVALSNVDAGDPVSYEIKVEHSLKVALVHTISF